MVVTISLGRARPRRRAGRVRIALAALLTAFVLGSGLFVYLWESVGARFDGRLWKLPSRLYSDALILRPGDRLRPDELIDRLDRCGYARVAGQPEHPGQYRVREGGLDLFVRRVSIPGLQFERDRFALALGGGRLAGLRDAQGRGASRVVLEPELLATFFGPRQEERRLVRLDGTPAQLLAAVLAAEDARFFEHPGLDFRGMARAALTNLRHGRIVQGGSTITQQTVKNLFLDQERTWWRKLRESLMSVVLDARYDKQRILEVYLNEVYLGQRGSVAICGVEAASRFYFGRTLSELDLAEWALLAGMIKSPGSYNPFKHPMRALARRDQILQAMYRLGQIEQHQLQRAQAEKLELGSGAGGFDGAEYVVDFIRSRLEARYPARVLQEQGLEIHTTVDTRLQRLSVEALGRGLERLERDVPRVREQVDRRRLQGAVVVTRTGTGEILAMVGGRNYGGSQFNRASMARRQPGSCFKPFVYAAGMQAERLTPATLLEDAPYALQAGDTWWRPANYDKSYRGPVSVRRALELSLNVPTVRAAQQVGLERVVRTAQACGITTPLSPLPSLALGTEEVTPLDLATAYGTLARGVRHEPTVVRAVVDGSGRVIEGRATPHQRVLSLQTSFLLTEMLGGVLERGTAKSAGRHGFSGRAAGKTGTTDDTRDAWFVGYTPRILGLVWIGYDDNASTGLTGATGALPIWADLIARGVGADAADWFPEPPGIEHREIDPATGLLAVGGCPDRAEESFARGSVPTSACEQHRRPLGRLWRKVRGKNRKNG